MPLDTLASIVTRPSVPEVFSAVTIFRNFDGFGNYSAISDCFICACVPMPDEDGGMSDADMIVYFDVTGRDEYKVVAVGYDGTPGPMTAADKDRLVAWFEAHQDEAHEIATEWMEDCR